MRENRVMKLWAAVVSAFLALCTALGFVTTTAAPAVAQTEPTRNSDETEGAVRTNVTPASAKPWLPAMSLPPTMKQRIRAEAHGKSPSCRHSPLPEGEPTADPASEPCTPEDPPPSLTRLVPLQR
ncbi:DUF6344 domain-containing protein [Streptomyces sp. NPDC002328]|uniref:DUF6344 domain-containing protein n=1 Tax=Streptomyces sp. NPDC002328 TaxID=3364642 RepID=UPI0036C88464